MTAGHQGAAGDAQSYGRRGDRQAKHREPTTGKLSPPRGGQHAEGKAEQHTSGDSQGRHEHRSLEFLFSSKLSLAPKTLLVKWKSRAPTAPG